MSSNAGMSNVEFALSRLYAGYLKADAFEVHIPMPEGGPEAYANRDDPMWRAAVAQGVVAGDGFGLAEFAIMRQGGGLYWSDAYTNFITGYNPGSQSYAPPAVWKDPTGLWGSRRSQDSLTLAEGMAIQRETNPFASRFYEKNGQYYVSDGTGEPVPTDPRYFQTMSVQAFLAGTQTGPELFVAYDANAVAQAGTGGQYAADLAFIATAKLAADIAAQRNPTIAHMAPLSAQEIATRAASTLAVPAPAVNTGTSGQTQPAAVPPVKTVQPIPGVSSSGWEPIITPSLPSLDLAVAQAHADLVAVADNKATTAATPEAKATQNGGLLILAGVALLAVLAGGD